MLAVREAPIGDEAQQQAVLSPVERALVRVWSAVLNVDAPSVDANFFDLGGHSAHMLILPLVISDLL